MAINRRLTIFKNQKKPKKTTQTHPFLIVCPWKSNNPKRRDNSCKARRVLIFYASFFQEGTNDFHILCHTCCQNKSLYTFKATSLIRETAVSDIINMKGRHFAALRRNERCPWLNFFDIFSCRRKLISWTVSPLSSTKNDAVHPLCHSLYTPFLISNTQRDTNPVHSVSTSQATKLRYNFLQTSD